jgi:hypothetical protein
MTETLHIRALQYHHQEQQQTRPGGFIVSFAISLWPLQITYMFGENC